MGPVLKGAVILGAFWGVIVAALLALLNPAVAARSRDALTMAVVVVSFYAAAGLAAGVVCAAPAAILRRAVSWLRERGLGVGLGAGLVMLGGGALFQGNAAAYRLSVPASCAAAGRVYAYFLFAGGVLAILGIAARRSGFARAFGKRIPFIAAPLLALAFPLSARTFRPAPSAPAPAFTRVDTGLKVYVVGVDGMDPGVVTSLRKAGRLPTLSRLTADGASGELATIPPGLSPPVWTTIATGRYPRDHGIADYQYFKIRGLKTPVWVFPSRTFLTLLARVGMGELSYYNGADRRAPALWNIASAAGVRTAVAGWLISTPAEKINGDMLTDYHIYGSRLTDEDAALVAYPAGLASEMRKYRDPPGDIRADAEARLLPPGVPPFYGRHFLKAYAGGRIQEDTSLQLLKRDAPTFAACYFSPVDPLSHLYWGFRPEVGTGRPEEVRRWGDVVNRAYAWADDYAGEILALADENTVVVVVSDHGFTTAPLSRRLYYLLWQGRRVTGVHDVEPPPAGFVGLAGGPVKKGVVLKGASVIDVAPNVLYLMGIPGADDMPGRVWTEVYEPSFLARFPERRIASYDGLVVERPAVGAAPSPRAEEERQKMLKALGYVK